MGGYKHSQLKSKSYYEIQKLFDKEMKRVNTFMDMNLDVVEGSKKAKTNKEQESSTKRAGNELEQEKAKKQKVDEHVEVGRNNDQEEEGFLNSILEFRIMGHYQLIRADGSSKSYSSMIRMLQNIDREELETIWKLVKAKHKNTKPEDEHERVLLGDLKVMFEPDIKNEVWRSLQGYKVTIWKLFDSCGVHFVRFKNLHIFMLVEKKYPLTPITITNMLNKKLQADHWNEMCYQLLKLLLKQQKNPWEVFECILLVIMKTFNDET
ncbi:hypothetical protein Tco_1106195 [Tanacetum coccineum]